MRDGKTTARINYVYDASIGPQAGCHGQAGYNLCACSRYLAAWQGRGIWK